MEKIHLQLLNELERLERKLLSWGIVEICFTDEEVTCVSRQIAPNAEPSELLQLLLDQRLLFKRRRDKQPVYRTRSAETVRLLSYLKQWMPGRDWRIAPNLVADFRFTASARHFPRRDRTIENLLDELSAKVTVAPGVNTRLRALVGERILSQFQVDSTISIIRGCGSKKNSGVVVSAGTGSGKTMCFYMPILSLFGSPARQDNATRVLALYPRNELLKDQFSAALKWVHQLNRLPINAGCRRLRIGAFFGPTPRNANDTYTLGANKVWTPFRNGFICPYARCPLCKSDLYWPTGTNDNEALKCVRDGGNNPCGFKLDHDEILLTRNRMQREKPDLLFTTTETLNRQLSDQRNQQIFGVNAANPPRTVLIDELHTYEGIHGAHVAGLIRRWRHAIGVDHPIQFTGLSATLRNANQFLSTITGVDCGAIEVVEPQPAHCYTSGAQYKVALRGDPVSATSLLSTTIQATMLMSRMLDPRNGGRSGGAFGSKVFVFTDDLDVTHRLSPNLKDAEGAPRMIGQPNRLPLAALRGSERDQARERGAAGQNWQTCQDIGHNLETPMRIGVTTSRNKGVDEHAQVIVATASLEVGYDDDSVGAVIQHKAPRGSAAFIQRIGRAGRMTTMRPWSVVALSDYGRDRLAYQQFETLFEPQLPSRSLPINNLYVMRIQSAYAFMEWLALNVPGGSSTWTALSGPSDNTGIQSWQRNCALLIQEVLINNGKNRTSLYLHLRGALGLDETRVRSIMWDEPRSLMFSVLPTLHRQINTNWRNEHTVKYNPLLGFVPSELFGDLNLPEVELVWPARNRPANQEPVEPNHEAMPLLQAMRAFAPGKVNRRFAANPNDPSLWIALPNLNGGNQQTDISLICSESDRTELEPVFLRSGTETTTVRLFRPWKSNLKPTPQDVLPQSNAQLVWRTEFVAPNIPEAWSLPKGVGWNDVIQEMRFHLHANGTQALVRRFTIGVNAETRLRNPPREIKTQLKYCVDNNEPAGIGFDFLADAVVFNIRVPANLVQSWLDRSDSARRSIRTAFFRSLVLNDPVLGTIANSFLLDRLQEVYLSTVSAFAAVRIAQGQPYSLSQAITNIHEEGLEQAVDGAFTSIFRAVNVGSGADAHQVDGGDEDEPDSELGSNTSTDDPRLVTRLRELVSNDDVKNRLLQHASSLEGALSNEQLQQFSSWLRTRYETTLGQALLATAQVLCPQTDAGDLLLDINPRVQTTNSDQGDITELWLSEELPGGTGVLEQLIREYSLDPRRFFGLLDAKLAPAEFEIVDEQLVRAVELACNDQGLTTILHESRNAIGNDAAFTSANALVDAFSVRKVRMTASVRSAIFARLARPGTTPETDKLLQLLINERNRIETSLGIEIDGRVFAHVASELPDVRTALATVAGGANITAYWYFQTVYSFLWPRGAQLRAQALQSYQPFASLPESDRLLLERVTDPSAEIRLPATLDDVWYRLVSESIAKNGTVRITTELNNQDLLRTAILRLAATPLDVEFLQLFPLPSRVILESNCATVTLRIREVA